MSLDTVRNMSKVSNVDEAEITNDSGFSFCAPLIPGARSRALVQIIRPKIILLDGSEIQTSVNIYSNAKTLLLKVCAYLKISDSESEIFGLYFRDIHNRKIWLKHSRRLDKQIKDVQPSHWIFVFRVKLYPSDTSQMLEDITRYYLTLQLRSDIVAQKLLASTNVLVALAAYVVQSELGDFDEKKYGTNTKYIEDFNFVRHQTPKFLERVAKAHKSIKGLIPVESDIKFLSIAMRLGTYGIHAAPAQDNSDNSDVTIGVNYSGLTIFDDKLVLCCFPWQIVTKIQSKRSLLIVTARSSIAPSSKLKSHVYRLADDKTTDTFLNLIIEHHVYFRLTDPDEMVFERNMSVTRSSRYSFDGPTLYNKHLTCKNKIQISPAKPRANSTRDSVVLNESMISKSLINSQICTSSPQAHADKGTTLKSSTSKTESAFDLKKFDSEFSKAYTKINTSTMEKQLAYQNPHSNLNTTENTPISSTGPNKKLAQNIGATEVHEHVKTLTIHTAEVPPEENKIVFPKIIKNQNSTVLPIQYAEDLKKPQDASKNEDSVSDPEFEKEIDSNLKHCRDKEEFDDTFANTGRV